MKRKIKIAAFVLLIFSSLIGFSQPFGNEWIDYSRPHYKFKITENGLYRISYESMLNAGIPVSTISMDDFQVFGKDREQPLWINDGGDNSFDFGDYIEFYGEKNDGWLDSLLYDEPNTIANPEYSLYNDTLTYFLTWKSGNHERFFQETDVNFTNYPSQNYFIQRESITYTNQYHGGYAINNAYSSFYQKGEGWGSSNWNGANNFTRTIPVATPFPYQGTDAPDVQFHGKSNANSNASFTGIGNHHLRWELQNTNRILYDEIFIGYRQTIVDTIFPSSLLTNGNTNILFKIIGDQGAQTDFQSINYLYLEYARQPNLNGQNYADFWIENATNSSKTRLDIVNANFTNPICYVFQGNIPRRIPMVQNSGQWQLLIPNSPNSPRQRVIISESNLAKNITKLTPVNGNGIFTNYSNLNFENAYLMIYHKSMISGATQYRNYRSSAAGGNNNAILCEIDELCLQFGGGVPKHILGIRRMAQYAYNQSVEKPTGLLIMGKGIREANEPNTFTGSGTRKSTSAYSQSLIPSYGYPSSDICITGKFLNSTSWAPAIPTGRIAVKNNEELIAYLNKIQTFEANQNQDDVYNKPNKEWQKQVIHFGGGTSSNEQLLFRSYLNSMKSTIEGPRFGGNVRSFFKDNSNPFNPLQTGEVNELLEEGVSLMTFFGHASATGFDQSIDEPENWGNTGKYPIVLGNSCYTGDIFQPTSVSASERFVLIPELGAIAFMSSTKLGFASFLNVYSSEFYRQFSNTNYGLSMGEQVIETIRNIEGSNTNYLLEATITQMTLHGDPAVKFNWHEKPEIDLTIEDISFNPSQFDLSTDSLEMQIVLTNLGQSITDTFSLSVRRNFPSSVVDSLYLININGLNYKDTIRIKMPVQQEIGIGMNSFDVQVDIPSFVDEIYDEVNNNQVLIDLFIDIDGINPVLPYDYAVVPNDSIVIKASTINPVADFNSYRFEIDTTDEFNSGFHKYALVNGFGGVKEVFPSDWRKVSSNTNETLLLEDSMVYFWRVAVDSSAPIWREHSFQYIEGKEGWGQDHFYQFKNGGFTGVSYNRPTRTKSFETSVGEMSCEVFDNANNASTYQQTLWKLNGQIMEYDACGTSPSIHVAVVDPNTMEAWGTFNQGQNVQNQFGNVNNGGACRNRVERYFIFRQNSSAQLQALENMILNEVPDGHYLMIYTMRSANYQNWQNLYPNLFNTFQTLGSDSIAPSRPNRAFIFFTEKGNPDNTIEIFAQSSGDFISLTAEITGMQNQGIERSTIIGPSARWNTIYWKQDASESISFDQTTLSIRALDASKTLQFQIDTTFTNNDSILNLNDLIPAENYPYLQLQARYTDLENQTPAQIDRWHILFDALPEAAIDGTELYTWLPSSQDSLKEGQDIQFAVDVKNIGNLPMDSLLVNYWVVNQNQNKIPIAYPRQDSLRVGGILRDTITFNSEGMVGNNTLWMEVNPYSFGVKDQPELAHFNNVLQVPFTIGSDDINPILDVTFDGLHILNGDIINPNAEIVITLQDNNPFLVMNQDQDTSLFGIFLSTPDGEQKRVPFINGSGQEIMQWIPADESNLKFKIIYPAKFTQEGEYELLIQGADKSGNLSGDLEYRVKFDVVLASSITHMMNYPNPFSTKTKFVFTLTGSKVPDEIIIQIMTVTGRVVREITQDELGQIRIGRNVTEYAWDGRDEFGDQLANGVYLYRVNARIDGESIDHRSSGADAHFKKNWGKMYLMR